MDSGNKWRSLLRPWHRRITAHVPTRYRRHYLMMLQLRQVPNLREPRTFNEKINWRILNDHRQLLVDSCDKVAMKALARERVPDETQLHIPRTLWSGRSLDELDELPADGNWVLKPNNDSGRILFGPMTIEQARAATADWATSSTAALGEWGYGQVEPKIVLEERLPLPTGVAPFDYKFWCFDGEPHFIQANSGRFGGPAMNLQYDIGYTRPVATVKGHPLGTVPAPTRLRDMQELARQLSQGFDFIRVDLYCIDDEIWFGEYTPYPNGGLYRFEPTEHLEAMSRLWTLPTLTPDGTALAQPASDAEPASV